MDVDAPMEVSDRIEAAREAEAIATLEGGIEDTQESEYQSCQEFNISSGDVLLKVDKAEQCMVESVETNESERVQEDDLINNLLEQMSAPEKEPEDQDNCEQNEMEPPSSHERLPSPPDVLSLSSAETKSEESSPSHPDVQIQGQEGTTATARNSRQKRNSLALRKNVPTRFSNVIAHWSADSSELYDVIHEVKEGNIMDDSASTHTGNKERAKKSSSNKKRSSRRKKKQKLGLLRTTCLNPFFSLRTQMMLSFGVVGVTSICVVMVVCIIVTILSGQEVNRITSDAFDRASMDIEGLTVRYIAEFVTHRLIPSDLVQIMWETTRDRLAGYPDALGYEQDAHVPFFDVESGTNRYPVVGPTLPLDWELNDPRYQNVNSENYYEHIQNRKEWYRIDADIAKRHGMNRLDVSTAAAGYFMQGVCNPNITDPTHPTYYPGCTEANNDVVSGGVVAPSSTNQWLHRKSADLIPVLKALYEYHQDVKSLGLAFANGGAGSTVEFPLHTIDSEALMYRRDVIG